MALKLHLPCWKYNKMDSAKDSNLLGYIVPGKSERLAQQIEYYYLFMISVPENSFKRFILAKLGLVIPF